MMAVTFNVSVRMRKQASTGVMTGMYIDPSKHKI